MAARVTRSIGIALAALGAVARSSPSPTGGPRRHPTPPRRRSPTRRCRRATSPPPAADTSPRSRGAAAGARRLPRRLQPTPPATRAPSPTGPPRTARARGSSTGSSSGSPASGASAPTGPAASARAGAIPMITWEPWSAPEGEKHVAEQPDISLARIADGHFDKLIRAWARDVAAYRGPVYIRLMHEMNGTWYPWGVHVNGNTPADFVAGLAPRAPRLRPRRRPQRQLDLVDQQPRADRRETTTSTGLYPGRQWVDWVRRAASTGATPTSGARGGRPTRSTAAPTRSSRGSASR